MHAQWSEHLQLKQETMGSIPGGWVPGFFSLPAGLVINVDGMICDTPNMDGALTFIHVVCW